MTPGDVWATLERAATLARRRAYAPYSKFSVGAAVLSKSGRVYSGCNVENASYGLALCAERSAIAQAVAAGDREFTHIVVDSASMPPASPCGMCRQVLAEFCQDLRIRLRSGRSREEYSLGELLPVAFSGKVLQRDGAARSSGSAARRQKRRRVE